MLIYTEADKNGEGSCKHLKNTLLHLYEEPIMNMNMNTFRVSIGTHKTVVSPVLVIALLCVALLLAACGSNGGTTTGSPGTQNTPTTTGPTATSSQGVTPTTNPTHATATPGPSASAVPFTSIRMLDSQNGWATTSSALLKTTDGGWHWHNVGPANTTLKFARGEFFSTQIAWVATKVANSANPYAIEVLRTLNGGQNWQTSVLTIDNEHEVMGPPDFVNMQDGWLELSSSGGPAAGSEAVEIYRTTDGGQTWSKVSATTNEQPNGGLPLGGIKSGISFKDTQNGWATANYYASDNAWLYVTHDGGKTWQKQSLPLNPSASNSEYDTTPPVFIGNDGLLPVHVSGSAQPVLDFYITHDGGQTWTSEPLAPFNSMNTYVVDMAHAWATDTNSNVFYRTVSGGVSWQKEQSATQTINALSFINDSEGWAIGSPNDKPLLLHTADGGQTWQRINYSVQ